MLIFYKYTKGEKMKKNYVYFLVYFYLYLVIIRMRKLFKIGISQITSHIALDEAKKGFKDAFDEAKLSVKFIETNANSGYGNLELNS